MWKKEKISLVKYLVEQGADINEIGKAHSYCSNNNKILSYHH